MVKRSLESAHRRFRESIHHDLNGFLGSVVRIAAPEAGLYPYRFRTSIGLKQIHLRVDTDGSGILFVDVTEVIHLNKTATLMAKLALDETPYPRALATLSRNLSLQDKPQVTRELSQVYVMINRFRNPETGCPTCAIDMLENAPLFSQPARAPYKADLALTYGCNNQCGHCYNEIDRFDMPTLRQDDLFKVIDKLVAVGVPHIIFTGGEATLHPNLPELIEYADSLGLVTGLNTNGRRIAHLPYSQLLADSGLNHVQVTLGSSRPETHDLMMGASSFQQTVKGIKNVVASQMHCITNTTLMRCNMGHIEEVIDFIFDLGIRTFAMNGMIYSGGGYQDPNAIPEDELRLLLIRVRDHSIEKGMRFSWYTPTEYCRMSPVELELGAKRCNAGEYSICIEPNGDVLPCQSYYVTAGNILKDDWNDIWNSELFTSFRDREKNPRFGQLPEKCWQCPDLPMCGGGCRIERQAREGIRTQSDSVTAYLGSTSGQIKEVPNALGIGFLPPNRSAARKNRSKGVSNNLIHLSVDPIVHPSDPNRSKSGNNGGLESTNGTCKCS